MVPVVLDIDSLAARRVTIINSVTQIPALGKEAELLITGGLSSAKPWHGLPFLVIPWHISPPKLRVWLLIIPAVIGVTWSERWCGCYFVLLALTISRYCQRGHELFMTLVCFSERVPCVHNKKRNCSMLQFVTMLLSSGPTRRTKPEEQMKLYITRRLQS